MAGMNVKMKLSSLRPLLSAFVVILLSVLSAQSPQAQDNGVKTLPPAYGPKMAELAETLGALHYLRQLCNRQEGQIWREHMLKLLELEQPVENRRRQLVSRFNRGFRGYREIYRKCTPPAAEAVNRMQQLGIRQTADIANRYGG